MVGMNDYATNAEHDAGISAAWDAYPDPPEMSRADLAQEGDWWHEYMREVHHEAPSGPLADALARAVAAIPDPCQGCGGQYPSVCEHGKAICAGCWPDLCWGCQEVVS